MTDESHYYHTLLEFNDLLRNGDIRGVLNDLRILDLTTYEQFVTVVAERKETERQVAAIFKPCM